MVLLGIETSCDETAVAVVANGCRVLASRVSSQEEIHALYGGVVPELASRRHLETIVPLYRLSLKDAGLQTSEISAVCATTTPGLAGSLLVGNHFGRAAASMLKVPFIPVNHLEAHLAVNFLDGLPDFPSLGLVVSGGHSTLFLVSGPNSYEVLGETRDDAAGETFDKVARALGLPYPGGPPLERLASGAATAVTFPLPGVRNTCDFSFSGLKTAVIYYLKDNPGADKASVAAGFQASVAGGILKRLDCALTRNPVKTILTGGGVLANNYLRGRLEQWAADKGVCLRIPERAHSLDNGVMVAVRGFHLLKKLQSTSSAC